MQCPVSCGPHCVAEHVSRVNLLYPWLIRLAAAVVLLFTALRGLRDASYRDRLPERLGLTKLRFAAGTAAPVWVHAVSVGEVQAAASLIRQLLTESPQRPVLITTATPTGAARVRALFGSDLGQRVQHAFLPYDTPGSVRRFLDRVQPHCLIIMETELWPMLLRQCRQRAIPVVVASARISLRTADRYQRMRTLFEPAMRNVHVAAQTAEDAARFIAMGAMPEQVAVTGNIKFDIGMDAALATAGKTLRASWGTRPVWIAGSTHAGEEEQVLAAHEQILTTHPDALLILAPRHPQRFAQVAQLLKSPAWHVAARSSQQPVTAQTNVLLLDTLGELTLFYAASDVVFVGGSLVTVGGHNLLEPAALSLPIISGPHVFNAPDIAARLADHAALRYVYSTAELADTVVQLIESPAVRQQQGDAALSVLTGNRGALQNVMTLIKQVAPFGVRG